MTDVSEPELRERSEPAAARPFPARADATVFLVDDDASVRDSTAIFLGLHGLRTQAFANAEDFLATYREDGAGCLMLDLKMPGMGGLELQKALARRGFPLPVIVVTAHGDVATVRTALKAGALDFLEKPVDKDLLLDAIRNALEFDAQRRRSLRLRDDRRERLARLTARERQVMELLAGGRHNREIAAALGISPRTVEVYKARMMEKLQARSLADVIRLALDNPPPA
ncbi:MAG: response regulator transcription factor [Gammaproteobacteria bacterium]|nr:response regulator transcription factor [Gammaproteobacteria bacterium]